MEKGNVIIDFYGDGCGNCKMIEGIIKQLETEYADKVRFEKVNVKDVPELVDKYGISSLPTLVFLKDGAVCEKSVGLKPKTVLAKKIIQFY